MTSLAIAGSIAAALLVASCGGNGGDEVEGPPASEVRTCVENGAGPLSKQGLVFAVKKQDKPESYGENEDFIGILINEPAGPSATAAIVVSDSGEFLDRLEDETRDDPSNVLVTRTGNAVVAYDAAMEGTLAKAKGLIDSCLQSG